MVELEIAKRGGIPADEAILDTHSVKYTRTFLQQAGLKIVRAHVGPGFDFTFKEAFDALAKEYPGEVAKARQLLQEAGIAETEKAQTGFDVYLDLAPETPEAGSLPVQLPVPAARTQQPAKPWYPSFLPMVPRRRDDQDQ